MERHDPTLLDQLDGMISLADAGWHLPPGRYAYLARTFRLISLVLETAAAVQRREMLGRLPISYDDRRK